MALRNVLSNLAKPFIGLLSLMITFLQLCAAPPIGTLVGMFCSSVIGLICSYSMIPGLHDKKETYTIE